MKWRNTEAERLESDYMSRLKDSLSGMQANEANEIIQSVREHIEEAVLELSEKEVSLTQMATILERLGPPEKLSQDFKEDNPVEYDEHAKVQDHISDKNNNNAFIKDSPQESNSIEVSMEPPLSLPDMKRIADALKTIWIGGVFSVIGLYIPVIELPLFAIIAYVVIIIGLKKFNRNEFHRLRELRSLVLVILILTGVTAILQIVDFLVRAKGMIALIPALCLLIICFVYYCKFMDGLSKIAYRMRSIELSELMMSYKWKYIIAFIVYLVVEISIVSAIAVGAHLDRKEQSLVMLCFLPLSWPIGWYFVLRPITKTRNLLLGKAEV